MTFYSQKRPLIENGKLVFITNGGSRELIGVRNARAELKRLETKTNLRPSSIERLNLLRAGVALWEAQ